MAQSVLNQLQETASFIRGKSPLKPRIGLVLGSGLGSFVESIKADTSISYDEIPYFAKPSVEGHPGRLVLGHCGSVPVAVLQGRIHYYEGHTMSQVVYPIRTLAMLGIEKLILSNSAGGLDPNMKSGDFMLIDDHINLMGNNPLMGPNIKNLGPRFPDMTEAYDPELTNKMVEVMKALKINYWRGVYCGVSGPTYETPAEVRFLQMIGGKAVGMSTVPESIAANHLGLRVCAISCITNPAAGITKSKLTHEEVTQTAKSIEKTFSQFLTTFISKLEAQN